LFDDNTGDKTRDYTIRAVAPQPDGGHNDSGFVTHATNPSRDVGVH
jgi:hypothetical protein